MQWFPAGIYIEFYNRNEKYCLRLQAYHREVRIHAWFFSYAAFFISRTGLLILRISGNQVNSDWQSKSFNAITQKWNSITYLFFRVHASAMNNKSLNHARKIIMQSLKYRTQNGLACNHTHLWGREMGVYRDIIINELSIVLLLTLTEWQGAIHKDRIILRGNGCRALEAFALQKPVSQSLISAISIQRCFR